MTSTSAQPCPGPPRCGYCIGDCNGDYGVNVDDLITLIDIALDQAPIDQCRIGDTDGSQTITIDEILAAVDYALHCGYCEGDACGNSYRASGEDCDDGGICVGGTNAGSRCFGETNCTGSGVCDGGPNIGRPCDSDDACACAACIHCKTFGGDGCAANCTSETDIPVTLEMGMVSGVDLEAGTSGIVVHSDVL
ncbi:MAG TPA: hypothetical protein VMT89_13295, partial [Candidatus Acidoferrales bacterium]|nr:hypothetical protein [Candidatus Acidoferrales bacterium]